MSVHGWVGQGNFSNNKLEYLIGKESSVNKIFVGIKVSQQKLIFYRQIFLYWSFIVNIFFRIDIKDFDTI